MNLNTQQILSTLSGSLSLIVCGDDAYIIDNYKSSNVEDFGVCTVLPKDELINPDAEDCLKKEDIPDIYIEGYKDFLLSDDLPNNYGIPKDVITSLGWNRAYEWDKRLMEQADTYRVTGEASLSLRCTEAAEAINGFCGLLRGEAPLPMTAENVRDLDIGEPPVYTVSNITYDIDVVEMLNKYTDKATSLRTAKLIGVNEDRWNAADTETKLKGVYYKISHNEVSVEDILGLPDKVVLPQDRLWTNDEIEDYIKEKVITSQLGTKSDVSLGAFTMTRDPEEITIPRDHDDI